MNRLGVGYELNPSESHPWLVSDYAQGISCNAEVRAGMDDHEGVVAAIEMIYDDPPEGKPPMDHVFSLHARYVNNGKWDIVAAHVRGKSVDDNLVGWKEKSCDFFFAVVQELKQDKIPDIDDLLENILFKKVRGSDQYGGGGGKSPKIKTEQLLNPKGRGF
ncbi:MAG: hypothetical protein KDJ15_05540 [Alphaproteobacteria bacterium]|nr:hypothetical protein [Alphaproteobacteria bacterium]